MGNRVIVRFDDSNGPACGVYLHWCGDDALGWLREAAPTLRKGSASYASARFVGLCCTKVPGGLSVGIMGPDHCTPEAAEWQDNGMLVVDCSTGRVTRVLGGGKKPRNCGKIKMGEF